MYNYNIPSITVIKKYYYNNNTFYHYDYYLINNRSTFPHNSLFFIENNLIINFICVKMVMANGVGGAHGPHVPRPVMVVRERECVLA